MGNTRKRSGDDGKGKGESAKFDADMNMNLVNVHIVPNVRDKPLKESPSNSPNNSDDEDGEGFGQDSSPWGTDPSPEGEAAAVPNRLAIKEMCRSVRAEQAGEAPKEEVGGWWRLEHELGPIVHYICIS